MPRPTRRFACFAPAAGLMPFNSISCLLEDLHQVIDLVDHAAHCGRVLQLAHAVDLAQAQAAHRGTVGFLGADRAADQLDLDGFLLGCHCLPFGQAEKMSSTDLPRLAATSAGVVEFLSASNVARTML